METKFLSLFSTPLWVTQVPESTSLNKQLSNARDKIKPGTDYFDVDDVSIKQLKEHITTFVNSSLMTYYETNQSFLHDIMLTGRQNPIMPNGLDTPHHHPGALLVGVYYIKVPELSGDILFHDPRGSVRWEDTTLCSLKSHKTDATIAKEMGGVSPSMFRPFHRLTPQPGTLILFPAYVTHQVETNLSNEIRMSVAITINLKSRKH
jgi:uncharacterized protein (TIGR02466 family)